MTHPIKFIQRANPDSDSFEHATGETHSAQSLQHCMILAAFQKFSSARQMANSAKVKNKSWFGVLNVVVLMLSDWCLLRESAVAMMAESQGDAPCRGLMAEVFSLYKKGLRVRLKLRALSDIPKL